LADKGPLAAFSAAALGADQVEAAKQVNQLNQTIPSLRAKRSNPAPGPDGAASGTGALAARWLAMPTRSVAERAGLLRCARNDG